MLFNLKLNILSKSYKSNFTILNEGLLIDFLQKKLISTIFKKLIFKTFLPLVDNWFFEKITYFFIDLNFFSKQYILKLNSFNLFYLLSTLFILSLVVIVISLITF